MNIIGFSFTKLNSSRVKPIKKGFTKDMAVDLYDVEQENTQFASKDKAIKTSFKFEVNYKDPEAKTDSLIGSVSIEGTVTLLMGDREAQEFLKVWKNKKVPDTVHEFLVNFVLRKCTAKSMELEDSVGLPFHIPIPRTRFASAKSK